MEPPLYELWQFIPEENENGGRVWSSAPRKFIPSDQTTLENLVNIMEAEDSVEEQWERLSPNKQILIKRLIDEHDQRDGRYRWSYVYIKTKTRKVKGIGNHRDITLRMDVILLRELQHQPIPARGSFKAVSAGHVGSQNSGILNTVLGSQPTLDDITRQANHAHIIGNGPGPYKAAENRGISFDGGEPSMHSQMHPQVQSSPFIYEQPTLHPQANPQDRLQGHRPTQPGPQQQGHPQVYPQMQNSMAPEANYGMPQGARFHGTQDPGMQKGQMTDKHGPRVSHLPINAPPVDGSTNTEAGPFARNGDESRHHTHHGSKTIYTRNSPRIQTQNARFAAGDHPPQARKADTTALPPKVVQQDRRAPLQDDSSFMTDDESLFEEEDGYSSAASSISSIAKGSLHREKRYMRRDMNDRGHRTHYRKQDQKRYSHGGYTSGNIDIIPSASGHRSRESRRYKNASRTSNHPVTVHESKLDIRTPGLAELNLSANEASYRLMKMEEAQRTIIDKMDRLGLGLQKPENRDYVEKGVAVRNIEPVMTQPVYYPPPPMYPRRPSYMPREMHPAYMHPYMYEPYL
jgi:hypothetical protein